MRIRPQLEHPAQGIASAFLRAIAEDDAVAVFERLSQRTRGLLEGLHAARSGGVLASDRDVAAVVAPLRASVVATLGGVERIGRFGVSGARVVDRHTAYVLLLPDVEKEGLLRPEDWRPAHLLAFVQESSARGGPGGAEWVVDLERTAALSADAELPDPLGSVA
ncbi:MAG: hypothetical protein KGJ98_04515 [Chloroflexota bacterium]|nr:hypothetical protein [Chloroflexota bacterium]MDE3101481.1 hypothetical protein [Chloroflexota bacterium]